MQMLWPAGKLCMLSSLSVVDCGRPASVEDAVLLSVTGTMYASVAIFGCDKGFVWRSGNNSSVCGADGQWKVATIICEGNKSQAHTDLISSPNII